MHQGTRYSIIKSTLIILLINFAERINAQSFHSIINVGTYWHTHSREIIQTSTNDYVLGGYYLDHFNYTAAKTITKLDSAGNLLWRKSYPPICNEAALYVDEFKNGNYLQSGGGYPLCLTQGPNYGFCSCYDTSGNHLWSITVGGDTFNFYLNDVIADLDGGFILVGCREDTFSTSAVFYKFDSTGTLIFEKRHFTRSFSNYNLGYNIFDFVRIEPYVDSTYYILGSYSYKPEFIHMDKNGDIMDTILVADSLGPGEVNIIYDFHLKDSILYSCIGTVTQSGNLLKQFFYEVNINNNNVTKTIINSRIISFYPLIRNEKLVMRICFNWDGEPNSMFEKIDSSQNVLWSYCIHPEFNVLNTKFNVAKDNNVIFTSSLDSIFTYKYEDVIYLKLDSNGAILNLPNLAESEIEIDLFPNPAARFINIKSSSLEIISINIYDIFGIQVDAFSTDGSLIDVTKIKAGIYIISINTRMGTILKRFCKIE